MVIENMKYMIIYDNMCVMYVRISHIWPTKCAKCTPVLKLFQRQNSSHWFLDI